MRRISATKRTLVSLFVAAVVVFLVLPFALKDRTKHRLLGPRLSELTHTEVTFRNGNLSLAGMLFLPDTTLPCAAVVFIHGSGASKRDNVWYLTVAKYLQENGVAVLVPDKRGSERSRGDWTTATFEDLAGDTDAAVDFLEHQAIFRCSKVGVVGFSQGGWIAPVAATRDPNIAFVVSMSGAGVTTDEQLLHEVANEITRFGTYHFVGRLLAPLGAGFVRRSAYWKVIGGFDPIPYWRKVTVPTFMAFGEGDQNVPVRQSIARMQALHNPNIVVRVYPKGGHAILDRVTYRVQQSYLRDLAAFVNTATIPR